MPRCIVLQVQDGQGPSPHFSGLTDGQVPYMLPQTQAFSVTLPNRRCIIMSDTFSSSPGAARQVRNSIFSYLSPSLS